MKPIAFVLLVTACHEGQLVDPYAVESAYGAALLRCVDEAKTLAESKSCRQRVNAEWGVVEAAAKDGGR